jgi:hypothetical protein
MSMATHAAARSTALRSVADARTTLGAVAVVEVDEGGGSLHLDLLGTKWWNRYSSSVAELVDGRNVVVGSSVEVDPKRGGGVDKVKAGWHAGKRELMHVHGR